MKYNTRKTFEIDGLGKMTMEASAWNYISIICSEAAERYFMLGLDGLAVPAKRCADDIHDKLKNLGYYD